MTALIVELLAADEIRDPTAERILDATLAQLVDSGFRRVSVEDVARRAGINRITIYRRFTNKDVLIRTALLREGRRIFAQVDEMVASLPAATDQIEAGFAAILSEMRRHPLIQRTLRSEPELAGHLVVTYGAAVVALGREYLSERFRRGQRRGRLAMFEPEPVAEILVRLTLSFLLTPDSWIPLDDEADLRSMARTYLLPLLYTGAASSG